MFDMDVLDVAPGEMELALVQDDEQSDRSKGDPKGPPVARAEREAYWLSADICWLKECSGMACWLGSFDVVSKPDS